VNELKWGISPTRNAKVEYQDGVIIMEHGADAVRAVASNGLTWTIDANAPQAQEIKLDKILFATGRVMGRVLKVERKGDGLAVTLGTVQITDVIKDCDISSDQPVSLASALVYTAPDYPGATTRDDNPVLPTIFAEPQAHLIQASYTPNAQDPNLPAVGAPKEILIDSFQVIPVCCGGLGITLAHNGQGVKMMATARRRAERPVRSFRSRHSRWYDLYSDGATQGHRRISSAFHRRNRCGHRRQHKAELLRSGRRDINRRVCRGPCPAARARSTPRCDSVLGIRCRNR
jgi:hypothetical protein